MLSIPEVRVHDRRTAHREWHERLPIASIAQTLLDFAASASIDRVRYALAEAEYRGLVDLDAIDKALGRGRPGSGRLRKALGRHQPRYATTRSELERAFLGVCERYRIPILQTNVFIEGWLVDAVWPERHLAVELDGHRAHRTRAQLERDHERDLQLRAAGFTVVRYTWKQITMRPQPVAADVLRLLGSV